MAIDRPSSTRHCCDAGSTNGDSYDVEFLGGSATAWAIISGRIAAMSAVERMGA